MKANINENKTELNEYENITGLSIWMKIICYMVALFLVIAIIYGLSGIMTDVLKSIVSKPAGDKITRVKVLAAVSTIYFIYKLTTNLGNHWRSSAKNEIGTAVTNFPNPFYDPSYKKGPLGFKMQYHKLLLKYQQMIAYKQKNEVHLKNLENIIESNTTAIKVLVRHSENANRLLKSLNYLHTEHVLGYKQRMLSDILSECITILDKDQSDKSISLFQIIGSRLKIVESVRINAESIANRSFAKGEGFAGYIWETKKAEIVNAIHTKDTRFSDQKHASTPIGSIMGVPLVVNDQILGVLCLQSESTNGFSKEDLRKVEFYVRLCTLILIHDKINNK